MVESSALSMVGMVIALSAGLLTGSAGDTRSDVVRHTPPAGHTSAMPEIGNVQTITRGEDGLFYLDGMVNGQKIHFLVDTGANSTILSPRDARRVGLASDRRHARGGRIQTASGSVPMRWVDIDDIALAGRHFSSVQVVVCGKCADTSLLGQDVLRRFGSIAIEDDRLTLTS